MGLMPIFSFYSRRGCWCFTHSWDLSAAGPVGSSTLYTKDVYPWQQGLHCSRAFYYWLLQWSQLQTIKCWGLTKWLPQWWHNGLIFHHALNCVSLCSQMLFNPLLKTERFTDFLLSPFCLCILLFPNQKKKKKKLTWGFCPSKAILIYRNIFLSSLLSLSHIAFFDLVALQ